MRFSIFALMLLPVLFSCSSSSLSDKKTSTEKHNIKHIYRIVAYDFSGKKIIPGAQVDVEYKLYGILKQDTTVVTNKWGSALVAIPPKPSPRMYYSKTRHKEIYVGTNYNSEISFKISKKGYLSGFGTDKQESSLWFSDGQYIGIDSSFCYATLIKPIDYFSEDFVGTKVFPSMEARVLNFINVLLLQGLLQNAELQPKSIHSNIFKEQIYLSLTFNSASIYNSLKLNKYDIGKSIFDEVVRKILNPLNDNLALVEELYGYDVVINVFTKSFADESAQKTKIEYRFYIPKEIVSKYKAKDISGQKVLDESIILMDDERIELQLQ